MARDACSRRPATWAKARRYRSSGWGVILGRAVAHEIGHYLLRTGGHARYGLMRTGVDARDFADLRNGAFYLDKESLRWVRQSLHPRPVAAARVAGFTY